MATIRDFAAPVAGVARLAYDQALDADIRATIAAGGVVQADSFPGASDSAKMTAAMTYAAAQTYRPWIQLPAREFNTGSTSYDMYNGMKICGPGIANAPKNPEAAGGVANQVGTWRTSCGTGANSLLRASTTIQSVAVCNVSFHLPGNASQVFRASGGNGCYPSVFHNLNMFGGPYFFGNPTEKFLTTQMTFSGHWQFTVNIDTPMTLGGGDCNLWVGGYANVDGVQGSGAGKPVIELSGFGKSNVGTIYMTNRTDWTGIRINNTSDKMLSFFGGMYEGQAQANLSTRPVFDIQGGTNNFYGIYTGQVSDVSGTVNGVIHQSGGAANFFGGSYYRGAAVSAAFPWLYQTGGTARIFGPPICAFNNAEQIRVRWADGTTQTLPAHVNAIDGKPVVEPVVTGSRSSGTALTSLLTTLANAGYITDSTTT